MSDLAFRKDKYMFSSKNDKRHLDKNILKKEISTFKRELKEFNLDLKELANEDFNLEDRNLILNIAYYLVYEEILLRKILLTKELKTKVIAKKTGFTNEKIEMWSKYLIAYLLLLYNADYTNLAMYLNINFRELETLSVIKGSKGEEVLHKGLVLLESKKGAIILTKDGDFIRIKTGSINKIGEELSGKEKKTFRHYKKIVISLSLISIIVIGSFTYFYKQQDTTILIQGSSKVKLGINRFDRIVYSYSPTEKGKILVTELNLDNKKFEDGMIEILKGFEEEDMLPANRIVDVYITGKMVDTLDLNKVTAYVESVNKDDNTNNNFRIKINNSGYEKKN